MSEASPIVALPCPSCGQLGSGNYCSQCGAPLVEEEKNPYRVFADSFLNIEGFRNYLNLYLYILKKPVTNTIAAFHRLKLEDTVKFLEYSVAIGVIFSGTRAMFRHIEETIVGHSILEEFFIEVMMLSYLAANYYLTMKLFYRLASKKFGQKNKTEYIKLYCLFAGFTLPVVIGLYFILGGMVFYKIPALQMLTSMASGILVLTYGTYIWQYFWKAPGNKIVGLLMMAGGIAFISSLVFLAILFGILNIDLRL